MTARLEITRAELESIINGMWIETELVDGINEALAEKGMETSVFDIRLAKWTTDAGSRKGLTKAQARRVMYFLATGEIRTRLTAEINEVFTSMFTTTEDVADVFATEVAKEVTSQEETETKMTETTVARFSIKEHSTKKGYVIVDNGVEMLDLFPTFEQAERHIHDILNVERIRSKTEQTKTITAYSPEFRERFRVEGEGKVYRVMDNNTITKDVFPTFEQAERYAVGLCRHYFRRLRNA